MHVHNADVWSHPDLIIYIFKAYEVTNRDLISHPATHWKPAPARPEGA